MAPDADITIDGVGNVFQSTELSDEVYFFQLPCPVLEHERLRMAAGRGHYARRWWVVSCSPCNPESYCPKVSRLGVAAV